MGKLAVDTKERAIFVLSGTLLAVGSTDWMNLTRLNNLALWGDFVGEVILERSFDGGATVLPCTALGEIVVFRGAASEVLDEPETGVLYRINLRDRKSGTLSWRVSR